VKAAGYLPCSLFDYFHVIMFASPYVYFITCVDEQALWRLCVPLAAQSWFTVCFFCTTHAVLFVNCSSRTFSGLHVRPASQQTALNNHL